MSLGVMCDDGFAVSYQPCPKETEHLIHHHIFPIQNTTDDDESRSDDDGKETISNGAHHQNTTTSTTSDNSQQFNYLTALNKSMNGDSSWGASPKKLPQRRPIEFPRNIIMKAVPASHGKYGSDIMEDSLSPMTKLLKEQERLAPPQMVPSVELYPIKLNYKIVDSNTSSSSSSSLDTTKSTGFVLVSRRTKVYDALQDLLKATAPETSSSCKRLWSFRECGKGDFSSKGSPATKIGDGYEVVDMESLDGKLVSVKKKGDKTKDPPLSTTTKTIPSLLVGEWIRTHGKHRQKLHNSTSSSNTFSDEDDDELKELDILVEIKHPNKTWPREKLQLENRVQVGDFVDAQDIAGKWFEAIVKEVTEYTVTVHYIGWASRWNTMLRKSKQTSEECELAKKINPRLQPIAPLWTHCRRWREGIANGTLLEVRDSMSKADRPKWYKGVVKKVGGVRGPYKPIEGGAELELLDGILGTTCNANGNAEKNAATLLLMNRKQQVLVEVEQEEQNTLPDPMLFAEIEMADSDSLISVDPLKPKPPFLRWVNLYGEEVCEAGTHMKIEANGDLAVVTLRYEYEAGRKPVEIMKSWNGMYGQGMVKESLRGTPPAPGAVGMHNLGNSCFLNSIVQCLNHIAPLTQYFLDGNFSKEINRKNPLGSGGHVAMAYATLLREVWSGNYSALAPRLLKQTVASFAPQFRNSFQHDSQEFCQFLMDGLHEDCNRVTNKPYVEELEGFGMKDENAAIETWRKHLLRHDSIIVDRCQGMHRSHLTCPSCGRESIKFDVFSTVSLPVVPYKEGSNNVIRVEDCVEKFLEGEQLDEMNAWYCPGCKKHVCALKMIALWSVPDILILHLKRFQFENCSVSNNILRSKIDDTVKFPIDNLDLTKYVLGPIDDDAPPIYNLFGVSEHVGTTATSGHYTATVRNCKDGRWYRYNDAHVGETTGDAAVTGGAYLLFYQRAKGDARWGGMEKTMQDKGIDPYGGLETDQDGFVMVKKK